jgi:hypothetical protein
MSLGKKTVDWFYSLIWSNHGNKLDRVSQFSRMSFKRRVNEYSNLTAEELESVSSFILEDTVIIIFVLLLILIAMILAGYFSNRLLESNRHWIALKVIRWRRRSL